jgi:hypothetical protein
MATNQQQMNWGTPPPLNMGTPPPLNMGTPPPLNFGLNQNNQGTGNTGYHGAFDSTGGIPVAPVIPIHTATTTTSPMGLPTTPTGSAATSLTSTANGILAGGGTPPSTTPPPSGTSTGGGTQTPPIGGNYIDSVYKQLEDASNGVDTQYDLKNKLDASNSAGAARDAFDRKNAIEVDKIRKQPGLTIAESDSMIRALDRNRAYEMSALAMDYAVKNQAYTSMSALADKQKELLLERKKDTLNYYNMLHGEAFQTQRDSAQHDYRISEMNVDTMNSIKKSIGLDLVSSNPDLAAKYMNATSFADIQSITDSNAKAATTVSGKVEALNNTVSLLDQIKNSPGLNTRVGPNALTRRFLAVGDSFGAGAAFAGAVHQLTSQETLQALINLKQQGGTLGALSDGERRALESAATKIGAWELKDKHDIGRGVWEVSEEDFNKELDNLKTLTNNAITRAGGVVGVTNQDYADVQAAMNAVHNASGTFNPAQYYPNSQ